MSSKLSMLGCWVACTRWSHTFENSTGTGYLEVDEMQTIEGPVDADLGVECLKVVSVASADVLLRNKYVGPKRVKHKT